MKLTLDKIVEYLSDDQFIKVTNTDQFPELSEETKKILKDYGLPSSERGCYPRMIADGELKRFRPGLIEIGIFPVTKDKYCIDVNLGDRVIFYDFNDNEIDVVNTTLRRFLECKFTMAYYYKEIEYAKKYGNYNENNLKYTNVLRQMLNEVEPHIENFSTWQDELFQKELGVI